MDLRHGGEITLEPNGQGICFRSPGRRQKHKKAATYGRPSRVNTVGCVAGFEPATFGLWATSTAPLRTA